MYSEIESLWLINVLSFKLWGWYAIGERIGLGQGSPNYSPRATSGPQTDFVRPAKS